MDSDVATSIVKVLIIGTFVAWLIIRSNKKDKETEKSTQNLKYVSFGEIQEKREESFKKALKEHEMPVLGDEDKEKELITKIDKTDMLNVPNRSFLEVIGAFIENIAVFIGYLAKIFFINIPLTLIGISLTIAGVALTIIWIGFVFGSVIGVVLLLIFCMECFLLPLAISALGLTIIAKAWDM